MRLNAQYLCTASGSDTFRLSSNGQSIRDRAFLVELNLSRRGATRRIPDLPPVVATAVASVHDICCSKSALDTEQTVIWAFMWADNPLTAYTVLGLGNLLGGITKV
jgi:hypothetical protein